MSVTKKEPNKTSSGSASMTYHLREMRKMNHLRIFLVFLIVLFRLNLARKSPIDVPNTYF